MKAIKTIQAIAFGLSFALAGALHAHSDAFQPKFVDKLVEPYLQIQKGLAGDSLEKAQAGAEAFLKAMEDAPDTEESTEEVADLTNPAKAIAEADDLKAARTAFLDLSVQMKTLVTHVGTESETPLYLMECPMAFGGSGGVWMQDHMTVENPYYGSMMYHCGGMQKQIGGKMSGDHDHHGPGMMDDHHDGHGMMHGHDY